MSLKFSFPFGILLLFIFSVSDAQRSINVFDHMLIKESDKYLYGAPVEKYEGTPYLTETFVMGYVYANKEKYTGVPMRYNMFDDKLEFQKNNQIYVLGPDPRIEKVELGDYILVVEKFKFLSKTENGYLELLESGQLTLMSKKVVNYRDKIIISDVPAKYTRSADMYYYKIGDGVVRKVDSIKKMIASLPDKQEELNQFTKNEKISPKDKDELIKLVKYYNSLVISH